MKSGKDLVCKFGGCFASTVLTTLLLMLTVVPAYSWTDYGLNTIIGHMLTHSGDVFLSSAINSAPLICTSIMHKWFPMFLPLLCTLPFISEISAELKGNYRLRLVREGSFSKYWRKTYFAGSLSSALSVTSGYLLFCAIVYSYFPKNSEFLTGYPEDSVEQFEIQREELNSSLNSLFHTQNEYIYVLNQVLIILFYAFAISLLCLLLFLLVKNKYKAIGLPLIVFFLLEQTVDSLWLKGHIKSLILSPRYLLFWTEISFKGWKLSIIWYFAVMVVLSVLMYFLGKMIFRKRVMN